MSRKSVRSAAKTISAFGATASGCTGRGRAEPATIALPVLGTGGARAGRKPSIAHSRAGRWRAAVLILVYLLMAAHVIQWLLSGRSVSPVEPSESMYTLETGVVNAGFLFFTAALIVTTLFGRFVCGWGCHIVALQDLCSWLMKKCGVKPKPFRSRLLAWVPFVMAMYMFVWPSFRRLVLRPLLADDQGRLPAWLGPSSEFPGVAAKLVVHDYWATFPSWYIAVPFLLACGFGVVYLLGSKGYCTYCCPYGGFFAPIDRISPVRIRVTDACEGCGHCTAVCTSNVRVHEEVRDFGMVVDPGCMKCLDCVSVCPNDALYLGLGRPALLARPTSAAAESRRQGALAARERRYDASGSQEVWIAALFVLFFYATRGLYDQVPMLMALGLAAMGAFLVFKAVLVLTVPNVRVQSLQLRLGGRSTGLGRIAVATGAACLVFALWGAAAKVAAYGPDLEYRGLDIPLESALRPEYVPTSAARSIAERAVRGLDRAHFIRRFGGWRASADDHARIAYLLLVSGDLERGERELRDAVRNGKPSDNMTSHLAGLMARRNAPKSEIDAMLAEALNGNKQLRMTRSALAASEMQDTASGPQPTGRGADRWREVLAGHNTGWIREFDPALYLDAAVFYLSAGLHDDARKAVGDALKEDPDGSVTLTRAAEICASLGEADRAATLLERATVHAASGVTPPDQARRLTSIAGVFASLGRTDRASELAARARRLAGRPDSADVELGVLYLRLGARDDGLSLVKAGLEDRTLTAWPLNSAAAHLREIGIQAGDEQLVRLALEAHTRAVEMEPESGLLRLEHATALFALGRTDEAAAEAEKAGELSLTSAAMATRVAELYEAAVRGDDALRWRNEAARRERATVRP